MQFPVSFFAFRDCAISSQVAFPYSLLLTGATRNVGSIITKELAAQQRFFEHVALLAAADASAENEAKYACHSTAVESHWKVDRSITLYR